MKKIFESVESRKELLRNYRMYDYEDALISIWSPGDYTKLINEDPKSIKDYEKMRSFFDIHIRQEFWDTEDNVPGYDSISAEQAKDLAEFIVTNKDKKFVIHCDAGQSRSAGVALAVECIIKYNGDKYLFSTAKETPFVGRSPRYSPNYFVYDKIITEYHKLKKGVVYELN